MDESADEVRTEPRPPLGRDEAERRSAAVRVDSYAVNLDLRSSPADGFRSRTTVRFAASDRATETFVDLVARSVERVTLNGNTLDGPDRGRLALPNLVADNELVVDATMDYSHDGEGLHRHVDPADGNVYLYAMSFLDAASRWFACFDQPDLKAPVSLHVRCPDDWTVAGNGPATKIAPGEWTLAATHPLATYFTTVIAGPYHSLRRTHDGIVFVLHARSSLAEHLDRDADELFEQSFAYMDELHRLFGVRYPWGEYHQAFVPDFNAGAMENAGCVTFRDTMVFRSRPTEQQRHDRADTIAHEMAHMWFGDLVTMRWWDDLWLNESFAEYLSHRIRAATGSDSAWIEFGISAKPWGYEADRRPSTHPVAGNAAADTTAALNEFDGISYAKGAVALRQLALRLDDDVLLAGLRLHFATHRFGSATLADLLASFSSAGAGDLDDWARRWLGTTGVDTLRTTATATGSTITGSERPHSVQIAAFDAGGVEVARRRAVLDGPLDVEHPPAALVLADAGDETWAKLAIDDWSALPALLPRLDAAPRAAVWNSIQLAAADAEIAPATLLDLVEAAVTDDDTALSHVLDWATTTVAGLYRPEPATGARIAGLAARVLTEAPAASNRALGAARAWIDATDDVQALRAWLTGDGPDGLVLDTDLRWRLLARLSALGAVRDTEIDAELATDRSSEGVVRARRCRTLLPDPAVKEAAWHELVGATELSNFEVYAIADSFWHPLQTELTAPYVERYFTDIPATADTRNIGIVLIVARLAFPRTAVEQRTLDLAAELVARDDVAGGVRRAVIDGADDVRRALAVRTAFPL